MNTQEVHDLRFELLRSGHTREILRFMLDEQTTQLGLAESTLGAILKGTSGLRDDEAVRELRLLAERYFAKYPFCRPNAPSEGEPDAEEKWYTVRIRELAKTIRDGVEAARLTREYVGEDTLPETDGFAWWDWTLNAENTLRDEAGAEKENG